MATDDFSGGGAHRGGAGDEPKEGYERERDGEVECDHSDAREGSEGT